MAYKSLSGDIKVVRNAIQDNTVNPYSGYTGSLSLSGSTKYVFSFHKKPAAGTPTSQELYDKRSREKDLPVVIDVGLAEDSPTAMRGGKQNELPIIIRCFSTPNNEITFKGNKMDSEELTLEKLNEIRHEFFNNITIKAAFAAAGLYIPRFDGNGNIRPIDAGPGDFGALMNITLMRTNAS